MISNETRQNVANELRHAAVYCDDRPLSLWWARLQSIACDYDDFANPRDLFKRLADLIEPETASDDPTNISKR